MVGFPCGEVVVKVVIASSDVPSSTSIRFPGPSASYAGGSGTDGLLPEGLIPMCSVFGGHRQPFGLLPKGLKSPVVNSDEGNGVYALVSVDREDVILADPHHLRKRQPFPNLNLHGLLTILDASSFGP